MGTFVDEIKMQLQICKSLNDFFFMFFFLRSFNNSECILIYDLLGQAAVYVVNNKNKTGLKTFSQLTQKHPTER